ncbi:MAG: hypothetical protein PHH93_07415 [Prolixibacteraceae bacterium]|nr:hypothetical protein [Prolixibacteraceae bacterium]
MVRLSSYGQESRDTTKIYRIETKDGNTYTGTIIKENANTLIVKTEKLGELSIQQEDIKSRTEISDMQKKEGEYWLPNPQATRYFWAPNGYGLKKNEGWYQNIWILYNQLSYGFTDNFSCGVGLVPLFLFGGTATPVWIVPKFSIPVSKDKFNIGAGTLLSTVIGEETEIFGLLYGTATLGSRDKNFSFGMAYGFYGNEWADIPVFNLSGMVRTGPRGYFVTENYLISAEGETGVMISAGGRSIIRNIGLDYSLWIPVFPDMGTFIAFPFLGITVPVNF